MPDGRVPGGLIGHKRTNPNRHAKEGGSVGLHRKSTYGYVANA